MIERYIKLEITFDVLSPYLIDLEGNQKNKTCNYLINTKKLRKIYDYNNGKEIGITWNDLKKLNNPSLLWLNMR